MVSSRCRWRFEKLPLAVKELSRPGGSSVGSDCFPGRTGRAVASYCDGPACQLHYASAVA